jgi:hypothetical protein
MDNPDTQATLGTRHATRTNKTKTQRSLRLSGIALSAFLLFIASDYLFGIFKLSNELKG